MGWLYWLQSKEKPLQRWPTGALIQQAAQDYNKSRTSLTRQMKKLLLAHREKELNHNQASARLCLPLPLLEATAEDQANDGLDNVNDYRRMHVRELAFAHEASFGRPHSGQKEIGYSIEDKGENFLGIFVTLPQRGPEQRQTKTG